MIFAEPAILASPVDVAHEISREATRHGSKCIRRIDIGHSPPLNTGTLGVDDRGGGIFSVRFQGMHAACSWARELAAALAPLTLVSATFFAGRDVFFRSRNAATFRLDFAALARLLAPALLAAGNTGAYWINTYSQNSAAGSQLFFDQPMPPQGLTNVELPSIGVWWRQTPWFDEIQDATLRFAAFRPSAHLRAAMTRELAAA